MPAGCRKEGSRHDGGHEEAARDDDAADEGHEHQVGHAEDAQRGQREVAARSRHRCHASEVAIGRTPC